jgi:hypothetical protein
LIAPFDTLDLAIEGLNAALVFNFAVNETKNYVNPFSGLIKRPEHV